MKKNRYLLLFFLFFLILFCGCGSNKKPEEYKKNMDIFYSDISAYDSTINSIDVSAAASVEELLAVPDQIQACFSWMASLSAPEEFSSVKPPAAEASESMRSAAALYYQSFEAEAFNRPAAMHRNVTNMQTMGVENTRYTAGEIPDGNDK